MPRQITSSFDRSIAINIYGISEVNLYIYIFSMLDLK